MHFRPKSAERRDQSAHDKPDRGLLQDSCTNQTASNAARLTVNNRGSSVIANSITWNAANHSTGRLPDTLIKSNIT